MTATSTDSARQAWNTIAADYDRRITDSNRALADRALDRVNIDDGTRVLDVAAGTGALSLAAANRGARVTAIDLSPVMVERVLERARAEGHDELVALAMDGHALEFADDSFDVAGSQFGVMLFGDLAAGLSEMARVTRPSGRVLMVTMGATPPELEFLGFFLGAVQAVAPDLPSPFANGPPPELQVADPNVLHRRMSEAGLSDVTVETVDHPLRFESGADHWDWITSSNPLGRAIVAGLSDAQGDEVRSVLDGMLQERATRGDGVLHNPVNVALGTAG
jgi:ubiquinone/menaquinone biosynthesis C-methylase UbiE